MNEEGGKIYWKCIITFYRLMVAYLWILIGLVRGIVTSTTYFKLQFLHDSRSAKLGE